MSPRSYRCSSGFGSCAAARDLGGSGAEHAPTGPELLEEGIHEVRRVVDGDTLLLDIRRPRSAARHRHARNGPRRLRRRSLGPGSQPVHQGFHRRAGNRVRLTFSLERKDRHDRFLAFVWNGDVMLNEELVRAGLAHARLDYRYSGPMKRRLARSPGRSPQGRAGNLVEPNGDRSQITGEEREIHGIALRSVIGPVPVFNFSTGTTAAPAQSSPCPTPS